MNSFEMSAPLVWAKDYVPTSGYSHLAVALGRILGGMSLDGKTYMLNREDFGMMAAQIILSEAGVRDFVVGVGTTPDRSRSYIATIDGTVWEVESKTMDGHLVTSGKIAKQGEVQANCVECVAMQESIRQAALKALMDEGHLKENDTFVGEALVDVHAAITMRPFGAGAIIVNRAGADVAGWRFVVDGPPVLDMSDAGSRMLFFPMDPQEIQKEKMKITSAQTATQLTSFNQKVAQA